jgi:hypothetical protein
MNLDIVNQKRIAIFETWANLDGKKKGLYGYKVSQMLDSFGTTYYIVNKNYQELSLALNSYEAKTKFWEPERQEERFLFFKEFSRLLHNYLSSTYTLIKQSYKISKEHKKSVRFYEKKIASLHKEDSYNFSMCLRHITQHFELLELEAHFSRRGIEIGQPFKRSIILGKDSLLERKYDLKEGVERDGFIKYVDSLDNIDLKIVLSEYQLLLVNFFEQFNLKTRELYASELKEYEAVDKEIQQLQLELRNTK